MVSKYIYTAFGLIFSSEIEIPEFLEATGEIQATISLGEIPKSISGSTYDGFRFQISANEFIIRFKPWASFYVCNGDKIIVQPETDADARDVRVYLFSSVIAILLHQRGWLPIHSSGIVVDNKAILFTANSGIGKSTIALALNKKFGYPLIADDIAVISEKDRTPIVYSTFPSSKLWKDSVEMLGISSDGLEFIRNDVFKYRYDNRAEFINGIFVPGVIFILENTDKDIVELTEIKGIEKFNALRIHIFRLGMVGDLYSGNHFKIITLLLNSARCYKILKPKNINCIDQLCSVVQNILKK
ncbi:MAG: hypothetical protein HY951_06920 [Bacteroidia bacterium]|nr:hypothetical protein [Bacteroidia bacterium]